VTVECQLTNSDDIFCQPKLQLILNYPLQACHEADRRFSNSLRIMEVELIFKVGGRNRQNGSIRAFVSVREGALKVIKPYWPRLQRDCLTRILEEISMRKQKGFSLIELLIVVAIILIIAAIAIPNLLRSKMSANNSAAASTIRTLNTAEVTYSTTYPSQGYATTLTELGPPAAGCSAGATSANACLVDSVIGCTAGSGTTPCPKSGYNYYLQSTAAAAPFGSYWLGANPITWDSTGNKTYCSNADAVIKAHVDASGFAGEVPAEGDCQNPTIYAPIQ
jgi:type IV pilus assembly protein PilA